MKKMTIKHHKNRNLSRKNTFFMKNIDNQTYSKSSL